MGGRRRVGIGADRNERKREGLSCRVGAEGETRRRGGEREADEACRADSRERQNHRAERDLCTNFFSPLHTF
jgi:hypothetical protein